VKKNFIGPNLLLTALSKIFEKAIYKRVIDFLKSNNTLNVKNWDLASISHWLNLYSILQIKSYMLLIIKCILVE
jgi:hypothetical protein